MKQPNDYTIEQIRETRHRISAAHGHDAEKLVNYYIELQKEFQQRDAKNRKTQSKISKPNKNLNTHF